MLIGGKSMFATVLGSSAKQTELRECVSILVDNGDDTILFDAGPGVVSALKKAHRKSASINSVILTHVHGDHSLGFAYFIFDRNGEIKKIKDCKREDYKLTVYGLHDAITLAQKTLELAYPGMKLLFDIDFIELTENEHIQSSNLAITFIPAIHAVPTLSTVLECENKKFVYTSDTLPNDKLIQSSLEANLLIHEGMFTMDNYEQSRKSKHSTAADAAKFATTIRAKQLSIVHIAPFVFGKETDLLREISLYYNGPASVPSDGCVYLV